MEQGQDNAAMATPEKAVAAELAQPKNNKNKIGVVVGIVCLVILAAAGLGFGAYAMITKDNAVAEAVASCAASRPTDTLEDAPESTPENIGGGTCQEEATNEAINDFYLIGDLMTGRRYYLGVSVVNPDKEIPDYEYYLIDVKRMGTNEVVKKYDMTSIIDKIRDEKVNSLPDTLAAGTVNEMPKSSCKSYRVSIGDVTDNPRNYDWTIGRDWSKLLPFTGYFECVFDGGRMSLGTNLYSLDPDTGVVNYISSWY